MVDLDPASDLVVCEEHLICMDRDKGCVACETGVEVRPNDYPKGPVRDGEFRNRITHDTMVRLIEVMDTYLEVKDQGPYWIAVEQWPKTRPLPAGYNETERAFNIFVYEFGHRQKAIITENNAQDTIQTLEEDDGD